MTVLIVDDAQALRERLAALIAEIEGYEVVGQAVDFSEAKGFLENMMPDVVVLDIRLPDGSGIDLLKMIRKSRDPQPEVIVFTNYPYPQYRDRCLDLGANCFLNKSDDFDKLEDILETWKNERRQGQWN